ncbi:UbiA family prenyltransferase [Niabella defluvii]|nr:UbiA family prenyltransferase [Niabella sp. I65]
MAYQKQMATRHFFVISSIGCAFFLMKELGYIKWIVPAIFLTLLYTAPKFPFQPFTTLKKFILGKTILLALMWTYVTTALPFFIMNQPWQYTYSLFFVNRFTLIFPICILFDLRDKEYDRQTGVKSLVTLLPSQKLK